MVSWNPPPPLLPAELEEGGVPRFLGEVEPRQGVGDPRASSGCWRRVLRLPALAAVLSRGLVAPARAPTPVLGVTCSSSLRFPLDSPSAQCSSAAPAARSFQPVAR